MTRGVVLGWLALVAARAWLGARLDLMGDEAFYWACSRRLDWGYSDHPPMTALLVRLGTALAGDTTFGVRWPFALCGALIPVALFALTRRIAGSRAAWIAAGLCLCMPLLQLTNTIATPDAPLMLLGVLTLACTARAAERRRPADWALAGLCAGLGLATHYRFVLVPLAVLLWMLLTRAGRSCWRARGAAWAVGLTLAGGVPVLLFNLREDFAPLAYQLVGRHTEAIGPRAWLNQLVEQGLVVTPVLYAATLVALADGWRALRRRDEAPNAGRADPPAPAPAPGAGLSEAGLGLVTFAGWVPFLVYFVASPLSDQKHNHVHWPQVGYLPLLVLVPAVLDRWRARGPGGRVAAWLAPGLGAAVLGLAMLDLVTGAFGVVPHRPFVGWSELAREVEARMAASGDPPPLLVGDTYAVAAELAFETGRDVYTLDHPMNARHGRGLQYEVWGRDEAGLRAQAGRDALVVIDRDETRSREKAAWDAHVHALFETVTTDLELRTGGHGYTILRATGVRASPPPAGPDAAPGPSDEGAPPDASPPAGR